MTDTALSYAEAQRDLSDALFRIWMQPLHLAQATLAAGTELFTRIGETRTEAVATPAVFRAAEEKIAHLDEEIDRAVPAPAGIVA